ncbi:MAG: permease [Bacillota bacterium]
MKLLMRYRLFLLTLAATIIIIFFNRETGIEALNITGYSLKEMLMVVPPVFILLGLLDIWVPRETMIKYMGEGSGIKGVLLAFLLGSAAAGPLYGAFPVAAVFMRKGVKLSNILIFLGAWSTTKLPMFLFEMASLGAWFAVTRLLVNIPGIILIAAILNALLSREEVQKIYMNAEAL